MCENVHVCVCARVCVIQSSDTEPQERSRKSTKIYYWREKHLTSVCNIEKVGMNLGMRLRNTNNQTTCITNIQNVVCAVNQ